MQNLSTSYTQTVYKQGLFTGFLFIHTLEIIIHKYKKVINMSGGGWRAFRTAVSRPDFVYFMDFLEKSN